MVQLTVEEAAARLPQLVNEVDADEEVILTQNNRPVFRLVKVSQERPRPQFGSARGKGYMTADFDAPLEEFEDYMP